MLDTLTLLYKIIVQLTYLSQEWSLQRIILEGHSLQAVKALNSFKPNYNIMDKQSRI
jgi:hypothetical protein